MDTLPAHYYYFFWLLEPALSLAGASYAIFRPQTYALDLLPAGVEAATDAVGASVRGRMLVGALGSCFFLVALVSFFLFPQFKRLPVRSQENLVRALLTPLAIGDVTHVVLTLVPLPSSLMLDMREWTQLIHGNVNVTFVLLAVRTAWFLGIGRKTAAQLEGKKRS